MADKLIPYIQRLQSMHPSGDGGLAVTQILPASLVHYWDAALMRCYYTAQHKMPAIPQVTVFGLNVPPQKLSKNDLTSAFKTSNSQFFNLQLLMHAVPMSQGAEFSSSRCRCIVHFYSLLVDHHGHCMEPYWMQPQQT